MIIIQTFEDIRTLAVQQAIPAAMADYLESELKLLHQSLEPEVPAERFSLDVHGPIVILASGEEKLTSLGMPGTVFELMAEWVSRKTIGGKEWYVIFVLADNDFMLQIYVPCEGLTPDLDEWLSEQAEEDETGEGRLPEGHPF